LYDKRLCYKCLISLFILTLGVWLLQVLYYSTRILWNFYMSFLVELHLSQASEGSSFFIVNYNVELWFTNIYAYYSFLSVTYQLLAKSLIQERCVHFYLFDMLVALGCFLQFFATRIWSMESCSLYKNKSIIR
jgi:hypothetical protein